MRKTLNTAVIRAPRVIVDVFREQARRSNSITTLGRTFWADYPSRAWVIGGYRIRGIHVGHFFVDRRLIVSWKGDLGSTSFRIMACLVVSAARHALLGNIAWGILVNFHVGSPFAMRGNSALVHEREHIVASARLWTNGARSLFEVTRCKSGTDRSRDLRNGYVHLKPPSRASFAHHRYFKPTSTGFQACSHR